jgi:hypothetical protein
VAAADIGDERARFQLGHDPVERGQPLGDQVRVVARPEEPLAALEDVGDVPARSLVPATVVMPTGTARSSGREWW